MHVEVDPDHAGRAPVHSGEAARLDRVTALGLTDRDRFQIATPPVHILGLLNIVTAVAAGARVRLHPRFDLDASLRAIAEDRLTLEMAVAPIALGMANHPTLEDFDLSSLRYIMWGATPVAEEVARTVTRRTGVRWLPAYGTSEVPVIAVNPVRLPISGASTASACRRARVGGADHRSGVPARCSPPARPARSRCGARRPWRATSPTPRPRRRSTTAGTAPATSAGSSPGVAAHHRPAQGDDEGAGFQVAPAEIEAVLHADPRCATARCSACDDATRRGDRGRGRAGVGRRRRARGTGGTRRRAAGELQAHHHLVLVDEIPRLPSGKALRRQLKERWQQESLT